mgnify:CR=1 FL=1
MADQDNSETKTLTKDWSCFQCRAYLYRAKALTELTEPHDMAWAEEAWDDDFLRHIDCLDWILHEFRATLDAAFAAIPSNGTRWSLVSEPDLQPVFFARWFGNGGSSATHAAWDADPITALYRLAAMLKMEGI